MELRVLRYFRAVVEEGSITDAAKAMHITQPTLSRQLSQLESEMGRPLFKRGKDGIELTAQGFILHRYATNIIELADKAVEEVARPSNSVTGTVHIGAGETHAFSLLAKAAKRVHEKYPGITFDLHDATAADLMDNFVKGYYDVLLDCDSGENANFNQMDLPIYDVWGVIVRRGDPLAFLDVVRPDDLVGRDIITSPQGMKRTMGKWAGEKLDHMNVIATYSLPLNAKFLASEGLGVLCSYGGLLDELRGADNLCFRPFSPTLEAHHKVLWRKTMPTKQTQVFLDELRTLCEGS